jgi:IS5 family transposase
MRRNGGFSWAEYPATTKHPKSRVRAGAEHTFRVSERRFGYRRVCYKAPAKNMVQACALANLWM